ncbi:hypothetical protein EDD18DRAFT_1085525, partial [Armillaria luteobubalina]
NVWSYWLMAANNVLTIQCMDPIQYPGTVSLHVHSMLGGSNFSLNLSTADLWGSDCMLIPVQEDKSSYWYLVHSYLLKKDGTFVTVSGSAMMYTCADYLFSDNSSLMTPFPDDVTLTVHAGDPNLCHTLNASSFTQQAITFLCLNFNSVSTKYNELPINQDCSSGIQLQILHPQNMDLEDHKSHVVFPSMGPDNGMCEDPNYPVTIPWIFMEVYWVMQGFQDQFLNGNPTGYSYHTDFSNCWESSVLQKAISKCHCNPYGDPLCCVAAGMFTIDQNARCFILNTIDEITTGNLSMLPGANPVQAPCYEEYVAMYMPVIVGPVYASTEESVVPNGMTEVVVSARMVDGGGMKPNGRCLWMGGARITRVPEVVLMVGVVMMIMGFV